MQIRDSNAGYGFISQLLHWLMALLIGLQFIWAWRFLQLGIGRERYELVNQHKSIGITLLLLILLRIIWRQFNRKPRPVSMSDRQKQAMKHVHRSMYVLLVVIPPLGWAMSSAGGFSVNWFDLMQLPALLEQNDAHKTLLRSMHATSAWLLGVLVVGHILMAGHHHFYLKDGLLWRMLPRLKR